MKKVFILLAVLAVIAIPVFSQDEATGQTGAPTTDQPGTQTTDQTGAQVQSDQNAEQVQPVAVARQKISELMGYDIVNADGDKVGDVKDFIVTSDGKIPYATATFSDVETDGDVIIPVQAFTFGNAPDNRQAATIGFDIRQVQGAPVIKDNRLEAGWDQTATGFWSGKVSGAETVQVQGGQAYLASRILGFQVTGSDDNNVGSVNDLMIDLENRQVAYVAMAVGGFLGIGENLFAIPMNAFQVNTENEDLMLNVSSDFFDDAQGFEKDNWPTEASASWQEDIQSRKQALGSGDARVEN